MKLKRGFTLLLRTVQVFLLALCFSFSGYSQAVLVITDSETLEPIPFATVEFENEETGEYRGQTTDINGRVTSPFQGPVTVSIRHLAYDYKTLRLSGSRETTIYLTPNETELNEMVVTGVSSKKSKEDVVYDVEVIDADQMDRMGANTLDQALANQMNIVPQRDGVLGSSLSLQGLQGRDVKILIDGVPLIGRQNGNIDLSQINLANIERIEVVEGPMSVLYGTDAHGGTINLITKKVQENTWQASASAYYETAGQYNIDAYGGLSRKRHTLRLGGGRYFFDGWSAQPAGRSHDWDPKENIFSELTYTYRFKRPLQLTSRSDFMNERILNRYERPSSLALTALEDIYTTKRFNQSVILEGDIAEKWKINSLHSYQYFQRSKNAYSKDLTTLESELLADTAGSDNQDTARMHQVMSRSSFVFTPNKKWEYTFGYDASWEQLETQRVRNGQATSITTLAFFTNAVWKPVERLTVQSGLRYGYNSAFALLPSPSLHFKADVTQHWSIRSSYGFGYRTPTTRELYFEFIDNNHRIFGNSDLTPERSHNIQFGAAGKYRAKRFVWRPEATAFYLHKKNTIAYTQQGIDGDLVPIFFLQNIGHLRVTGGNTSLSFEGTDWSFSGSVGTIGTYNSYADDFDLSPYQFMAQAQLNASYTIAKWNTTFSLFTKYNGRQRSFVLNNEEQIETAEIEGFTLLDLSVRQSLWNDRIQLRAGIKNLLDVGTLNSTANTGAHSGDGGALMGMGRNYFFGFKIQTGKR